MCPPWSMPFGLMHASPPEESASTGSETAGGTHDTGTHEAASKSDGTVGSRVSGSRMNPNAPSCRPP